MTRGRRRVLAWTGGGAAVLIAGAAAAILVLQSDWFFGQVRAKLVSTLETATGGRIEIGSFRFHWKELRAEARDIVIHGTEPPGKPPLFRAERVEIGLKILSVIHRDINIAALDVMRPRVYLIVGPDGRTNVPEPKVPAKAGRDTMQTILDLAIGRFSLQEGWAEVEARGRTPFDARGENLRTRFLYHSLAPRYQGEIEINPLRLNLPGVAPLALTVGLTAGIERNRVRVESGTISTGGSQLTLSGTLEDLANPRAVFHYRAIAQLGDVIAALKEKTRLTGTAVVEGEGVYKGGSDISATGSLHAFGLEYRDDDMRIHKGKADGAVDLTLERVIGSRLRITATYADKTATVPAGVEIRTVELNRNGLKASGIAVAALGGMFRGDGELRGFDRFAARGQLSGFEIRRLVAIYSNQPLPWDGRLSGTAQAEGSLRARKSVVLGARIEIAPAAQGAPVSGHAEIQYDARSGTLELGRSYVQLPSTRATASGAVGTRLQVHAETRDLNDILPAVGAAKIPLRIESGAILFDGEVTGNLDAPRIAGKLSAGRLSYEGTAIDSLQADVTASPDRVAAKSLLLARGALRARGKGSIGLVEWKPVDASAIEADVEIQDAALPDLLAVANQKDVNVTGTLSAAVQVGGTLANPAAKANVTVVKGSLAEEPFDRFTAEGAYTGRVLRISQARIAAGERQIDVSGSYTPGAAGFASGRLEFKLASNAMGLDRFRALEKARPGIQGTVILSAAGTLELEPPRPGGDRFRVTAIETDLRARGLQLTGQPLGDLRLTAASEGDVVTARLASDFANSRIRGEGKWKLAGDYPGSATISFTRLDFQQVRAWISPKREPGQFDLAGSAEGELTIDGPASKPDAWKATLRIPKLEVAPAPASALAGGRAPLGLHNEGPIVATMANQVVTVDTARLVGRSTDLTLTGKAALQARNALDLRVNGRLDLAILQDFSRDVVSSGLVIADATIRGPLQSPQFNGRLELKDAALNLAEFPNGLSRANGVILFTGDRATIQSLSGETGGGKVTLSGFAGYGAGDAIFRIDASAEEVRVRYPEGVSTVADAELNLTGTLSRSMLTGTVTILRTGFNPQSDFSSILAKSSEPVRTASARTGFLGGLNFDIQIETSPDLTVQSSLAEGVQVEANMRLRGTASNPAVLGRINITQGQIVFFGTQYTINQGAIAFYNPVKVEPVLNVDLETKARGVDVTLTVSGPLNKLQLTPRSDPPLQFSEIVALLATGRAPTSDPSILSQQTTGPQNFQQMGASALLGQAIANPVAGRLQRFFGVSKLKIDPSLTGVENNPQARLTLEQQVTQNITFTYITNITSSNPQVVRVEWALTPRWSAVAVREENGLFGIDFLFKKRFK